MDNIKSITSELVEVVDKEKKAKYDLIDKNKELSRELKALQNEPKKVKLSEFE